MRATFSLTFRWNLVNWPATATFTSLRWVGLNCGNSNYCTHRWNLCLFRDQTNVGGRGKQIRWQVDCSAEERWHSLSRSRQAFSLTGLSSRCWENLVLAMLGEQFMVGEEICGAVVSIRFQEDILRWGSVKGYSFCKFFPKHFLQHLEPDCMRSGRDQQDQRYIQTGSHISCYFIFLDWRFLFVHCRSHPGAQSSNWHGDRVQGS